MVDNSRVAIKIATNKGAVIFFTLGSGQNTPSILNETDLHNLNNEKILQYIKRSQATLKQYKTQRETSFIATKGKEEASIYTPRT